MTVSDQIQLAVESLEALNEERLEEVRELELAAESVRKRIQEKRTVLMKNRAAIRALKSNPEYVPLVSDTEPSNPSVSVDLSGMTMVEAMKALAKEFGITSFTLNEGVQLLQDAGFVTRKNRFPSKRSVADALSDAVANGVFKKPKRNCYVIP